MNRRGTWSGGMHRRSVLVVFLGSLLVLTAVRLKKSAATVELEAAESRHPIYRELMRRMDAVAAHDKKQKRLVKLGELKHAGQNAGHKWDPGCTVGDGDCEEGAPAGKDTLIVPKEQNVFDDWDHDFVQEHGDGDWEGHGDGPEYNVYDELPTLEDVKEDPDVVQGVLEKWGITKHLEEDYPAAWAAVDGHKPMTEHFADTGYHGR